jgi:hypothetical protein
MTTIVTKNGSGAPLASDLVQGELAVDLTNKRLYTEDSGGSVIELGSNPTSLTTGTFTSTGIDDNATSTAITIDASENVGIGTDTVSLAAGYTTVNINGSAGGQIHFSDDDVKVADFTANAGNLFIQSAGVTSFRTGGFGSGDEAMRIDSSGNVGIGNSSPSDAYATAPNLVLGNTSDTFSGMTLFTSASGSQRILFADGTTGTDNRVGQLAYDHSDNSMAFSTNASEAMRIDSSGNVGIGTTSPAATFSKAGSLDANGIVVSRGQLNANQTNAVVLEYGSNIAAIRAYGATAGTGQLVFKTGGGGGSADNEAMRIDSSGNVGIGTDGPSAPLTVKARDVDTIGLRILENSSGNSTIQFTDDPVTTGYGSIEVSSASFSVGGSGNFIIKAANVEKARIDTSGNLLVGQTASVSSRVDIKGASNTSSDYSLFCKNSDSTLSFYVRNDGIINVGQDGNSPYNYSVTGRDLYVDSVGTMGYLSSTRESKANIESLSDISWLYNLSPVSFNYREKDQETGSYTDQIIQEIEYGLIADEVEQVNPNLCFYDADEEGNQTLAGVSYRKLIPVLTKAIQEQQAMIEELKAEVAALKGA